MSPNDAIPPLMLSPHPDIEPMFKTKSNDRICRIAHGSACDG